MRVRPAILLAALAGALVVAPLAGPAAADRPESAGRFVVTLRDAADPHRVADEYRGQGGNEIDYVYTAALRGFAGDFSSAGLGRLQADGRVARIERDGVARTTAVGSWGLDRTDEVDLPLDGAYGYDTDGSGVTAYIIDTGVRASHQDFGNRVLTGFTAIDDGRGTDDCNGHGTHVAGTVGGTTYGIAKAVKIVPVRVLNCRGSGTWSGVIAGVDWVTANHAAGTSVANMSLGGGGYDLLDQAVTNSINAGVVYAVAAGNSDADACNYSPARVTGALTVGATTDTDARAYYSNFGTCLDLFAPGSAITSAWHKSDTSTNTISGTSMASPHVAGIAARLLGSGTAPGDVPGAVTTAATTGKVGDPGPGSVNLLLHLLAPATTEPEPEPEPDPDGNTAPTVDLAAPDCGGTSTCDFTAAASDTDGSIAGYAWTGASGSGSTATATYGSPGTYTVSVTVTDDDGATGSDAVDVSCSWSGKGRWKVLVCA